MRLGNFKLQIIFKSKPTSTLMHPIYTNLKPEWVEAGPHRQQVVRGTRAQGRAFEKKVGKRLHTLSNELNWEFHDHHWIKVPKLDGTSFYLQPDFVLISPSKGALLIECKLTWTPDAEAQLTRYMKVLNLMGLRPVPILTCRNLTPDTPENVKTLCECEPWSVWHQFI